MEYFSRTKHELMPRLSLRRLDKLDYFNVSFRWAGALEEKGPQLLVQEQARQQKTSQPFQ